MLCGSERTQRMECIARESRVGSREDDALRVHAHCGVVDRGHRAEFAVEVDVGVNVIRR